MKLNCAEHRLLSLFPETQTVCVRVVFSKHYEDITATVASRGVASHVANKEAVGLVALLVWAPRSKLSTSGETNRLITGT